MDVKENPSRRRNRIKNVTAATGGTGLIGLGALVYFYWDELYLRTFGVSNAHTVMEPSDWKERRRRAHDLTRLYLKSPRAYEALFFSTIDAWLEAYDEKDIHNTFPNHLIWGLESQAYRRGQDHENSDIACRALEKAIAIHVYPLQNASNHVLGGSGLSSLILLDNSHLLSQFDDRQKQTLYVLADTSAGILKHFTEVRVPSSLWTSHDAASEVYIGLLAAKYSGNIRAQQDILSYGKHFKVITSSDPAVAIEQSRELFETEPDLRPIIQRTLGRELPSRKTECTSCPDFKGRNY